jgi:hypothetical protein
LALFCRGGPGQSTAASGVKQTLSDRSGDGEF